MANTVMSATLAVALLFMAGSAVLARPVTHVQAVGQRSLLQAPPQCTNCINPNLQCGKSTVQCLPGTTVDVRAAAQCDRTEGQNPPLCGSPRSGAPLEVACPVHGGIVSASVCEAAIALNGATCPDKCVPVTVVAQCDLNGQTARSKATCANTKLACTPGTEVDISELGCTSTNSFADASKDSFYFPINKALSTTARTVKCPPAGKSCQYRVGALPTNGCKAAIPDLMATVTLGDGPTDHSGACEKPY